MVTTRPQALPRVCDAERVPAAGKRAAPPPRERWHTSSGVPPPPGTNAYCGTNFWAYAKLWAGDAGQGVSDERERSANPGTRRARQQATQRSTWHNKRTRCW